MAPRRSKRVRNTSDQETSDILQEVTPLVKKGTKRKPTAEPKVAQDAGSLKKARKGASKVAGRAAVGDAKRPDVQNRDRLTSLSPDIFNMIANNITDQPSMSALSRTSKGLYALMAPRLYKRVTVSAMFHAHIAKLIRTLEPHLTIEQKKQLKTEGKYKGQQEKYPAGLDEKKVPACASHVRQLIIGESDPGKKHRYIVERYYEEALKNMRNLEIVETRMVNKSMSEKIASLAGLKALSVYTLNSESDEVAPLAQTKNLKHLDLRMSCDVLATGQSIIRNSMLTLQSLNMFSYMGCSHYFQNWEKNLKSNGYNVANRVRTGPDLPALRSFHIAGVRVDEEFTKEFVKAVDLSKLRELDIAQLEENRDLLWPSLINLNNSYKNSNTPLCLRTLSIDMDDFSDHPMYGSEGNKAQFAGKCRFIASFDTLTSLELRNYGQYSSSDGTGNPGLSDALLEAILKHKNLEVLRICYQGIMSGLSIPYLGANPIAHFIDGFHNLRELEFAPDETHIDDISQALSRGKNLETVICFPHQSWESPIIEGDQLGMNILTSVLSAFVSNATVDSDSPKFVWEDHYQLSRLSLTHRTWRLASKPGKRQKGCGKPEKFQVDVEGNSREVWYQRADDPVYINLGYDPRAPWVTRVEKDTL